MMRIHPDYLTTIMKTINKILIIAVAFVSFSMSATAQKFGYINSQELISQLPEVKEANANIETLKAQLQKKGQEMIVALQTKYGKLEADRDNYSPKQLETEAQKLQEEEKKIAEFEQTSTQRIMTKSEELLKPIQERINTAIKAVATENGYTYIFDASLGVVLYADPGTDVTALVKSKL